jgi:hypothetical protein
VKTTLDGVSAATPVEVDAVVTTEDSVKSPMTGVDAALIVVDVIERATPLEHEVGRVVLGDTLALRAPGGEIAIVARRARFVFVGNDSGGELLERVPAEIAAVLSGARGKGPLAWREHVVKHGTRVRLRAIVEASGGRFVVRGDLAPIIVSEIV